MRRTRVASPALGDTSKRMTGAIVAITISSAALPFSRSYCSCASLAEGTSREEGKENGQRKNEGRCASRHPSMNRHEILARDSIWGRCPPVSHGAGCLSAIVFSGSRATGGQAAASRGINPSMSARHTERARNPVADRALGPVGATPLPSLRLLLPSLSLPPPPDDEALSAHRSGVRASTLPTAGAAGIE